MTSDPSWRKIFDDYDIHRHNFADAPFVITSKQINQSCQDFKRPSDKESRILCKQDFRKDKPEIFNEYNLFMLPIKNGIYALIQGEGYFDLPDIETEVIPYQAKLKFPLETSKVGDSEMQHLDYAYASSLIRSFMEDDSLILTIRGRKFTREFSFLAGDHNHTITVRSVQTEVDAGYEGKNRIVLVEAKNSPRRNAIIRQIYYPFRQWQLHTTKPMELIFFEKRGEDCCIWRLEFTDVNHYNSMEILNSARYRILD